MHLVNTNAFPTLEKDSAFPCRPVIGEIFGHNHSKSKWSVIFLQSPTSTGYFSNSTGSSVTNCRFSPIIGKDQNSYPTDSNLRLHQGQHRSPKIHHLVPVSRTAVEVTASPVLHLHRSYIPETWGRCRNILAPAALIPLDSALAFDPEACCSLSKSTNIW